MKHYVMRIRRDGVTEWLTMPPGLNLPVLKQTRQRYSEILPVNPVKRLVFRLLRWVFGENGWVSEWTRGWVCYWRAEILLGPGKGRTMENGLRCVLIEWEHDQWAMNLRNQ